MKETFINLLIGIETFFTEYQFTKDFFITCLGVIFGGGITILINRGAIRKEAYFKLQYETLSELIDEVYQLEKSIEHLEIGLSFGTRETATFEDQITSIEKSALALNEVFREKRNLIHQCLTGVMLEESAHIPGTFLGIFLDKEKASITNLRRKNMLSIDDVEKLRNLTNDVRKLKNQMIDSLESIIFPGFFSKVIRNLKKIKVVCGNLYGIWKVNRRKSNK